MRLTNDSYTIFISTRTWTERYYRDEAGWLKVSTRGRKFRATAEQVLNHLLPALAGIKPNLTVKVEHQDAHRAPGTRRTSSPAARGSNSIRNLRLDELGKQSE